MDLLAAYGWNSDFAQHLGEDGCVPARVISQQRGRYWAVSASGELPVELSGRLRFQAAVPRQLPAVGDWLAVRLSAEPEGNGDPRLAEEERYRARERWPHDTRADPGCQRGHGIHSHLRSTETLIFVAWSATSR